MEALLALYVFPEMAAMGTVLMGEKVGLEDEEKEKEDDEEEKEDEEEEEEEAGFGY